MFSRAFVLAILAALPPTGIPAGELNLASHFPRYTEHNPDVPVYAVCKGRTIHRFFDTAPISPSGRYLALLRMPYEDRTPSAGDAGDVVVVDLQSGRERTVAQSRGWEVQVGANVQWGRSDAELYFNDVDPATWRAFAVQLNPETGQRRRMEGTVFMVSPDGKTLASHNLITSRRAQPGYGVVIPDNLLPPETIGPSADDGIWLTDTDTGKCRMLVSTEQIYRQSAPSFRLEHPEKFHFYLFQVKWNPQGTRLMASVQWSPFGSTRRERVVVTMNSDGSDIRTAVTAAQWSRGGHHMCWCPDGAHVSMNLNIDDDRAIELVTVGYDGSDLRQVFKPGSGHPSFHPGGRYIVADCYPSEPVAFGDGSVPIRLIDTKKGTCQNIVRVYVSSTKGEFRVDAHPAWDRSGRYVVFNGVADGTRTVYIADLAGYLEKTAAVPSRNQPAPRSKELKQ